VIAAAPNHVAAGRDYFIDTLELADLAALRRIVAAVANRINPARPFLHMASPTDSAYRGVTDPRTVQG